MASSGPKIMSSHDLLDDEHLLKNTAEEVAQPKLHEVNKTEEDAEQKHATAKRKLKDATAAATCTNGSERSGPSTSGPTESFDEMMRHKLREKQQSLEKSKAPSNAESEQAKCAAAPCCL